MATAQIILQIKFFDFLFGDQSGFICIATGDPNLPKDKGFRQSFFRWPNQKEEMCQFIEAASMRKNVWFGVNILSRPQRTKEYCQPSNLLWADLDTCPPNQVKPEPSIIIESSPGRYQAIWRTESFLEPEIAEEYSKRIAYQHRNNGADSSGWDLTQLLRAPFTFNYKYQERPEVTPLAAHDEFVNPEDFEKLEQPPQEVTTTVEDKDVPDLSKLPDADTIMYKYSRALYDDGGFMPLYVADMEEGADWSKILWKLINIAIEAGMEQEEVFAVMWPAKCNKYARDNRPPRFLWREVQKAYAKQLEVMKIIGQPTTRLVMPQIYESDSATPTFIDEYVEWATEATDAIPQFHELSAAIALSAILSSHIIMKASYGTEIPNLWGLVLGDSTLSRKTTSMRMAMDIVAEVDSEIILATDGSAEGLLQGLSQRPNRSSIYYKDEVSGFFDSINKKDYLAGLPEILTNLYDSPSNYTRMLRKETIRIHNPVLIFFGGGIRERTYQLIREEYILSGFLPRFLVITGDTDMARIRRTGPPTSNVDLGREILVGKLADMKEYYGRSIQMKIGGQDVLVPNKIEAILEEEAWEHSGEIEMLMAKEASESPHYLLALPSFERMSRSLRKLAILLGAARQEPHENKITITKQDVINAAKFIQTWGHSMTDLIVNVGRPLAQRQMDKILGAITRDPGMLRSKLMQNYHLTKREADEILGTLEDRGQIRVHRQGPARYLWPI